MRECEINLKGGGGREEEGGGGGGRRERGGGGGGGRRYQEEGFLFLCFGIGHLDSEFSVFKRGRWFFV